MQRFRELVFRLWGSLARRRSDADLEQELSAHLQLAAEDARDRGRTPEAADRQARVIAGNPSVAFESMRDQRGIPWLEDLLRDPKHGMRLLRRSPVFTAAATVSLALGIGANTAIFSLVDSAMLRPLPVRAPERLVQLVRHRPPYSRVPFSYPQYQALRDDVSSFEGLVATAWLPRREAIVDGDPDLVDIELVSDN